MENKTICLLKQTSLIWSNSIATVRSGSETFICSVLDRLELNGLFVLP